ncbi:MAG: nicotinate-nucleotide--dimethylbenzimidazole phosphoribosyltransferase [Elusimicrobiota bacterium]
MELLRKTLQNIEPINAEFMKFAQKRLDSLTKPQGSLGRLEETAKKICGITRKRNPHLDVKVVITMAADHGVTDEGISAYPKEVTPQMVYNFIKGGAGINVLARHIGAKVIVVDVGVAADLEQSDGLVSHKVGYGTKNMAKGPAMTEDEAVSCVEAGIEIAQAEIEKGANIIGTGDMGIGNTTASSAVTAVITGADVSNITGKGTGIDDKKLEHKISVIRKTLEINKPDREKALDVLSKVGGFEIGGIAGVILACASNKIPVVIDGFISGAGALIAYALDPKTADYMIASHLSVECGHKTILDHIGLKPLFDLDLRLGEGTGAALGIGFCDASLKILNEMASFKEAGVSEKQ